MPDVLSLGGVAFTDYSPPSSMMLGGRQSLVIHKLPGGSRVIDELGPDDADIAWSGFFFGDDTATLVTTLDAMRAAGGVIPLIFAGQYRSVILEQFIARWRRFPVWAEYEITCVVAQNPSQGVLGAAVTTIDSLVSGDLSFAVTLGGGGLQ
jgi:hypothetical protein